MIDKAENTNGNVKEKAIVWKEDVLPAMDTLRAVVDNIETKVDEKYWPMPSYVDLLFGI